VELSDESLLEITMRTLDQVGLRMRNSAGAMNYIQRTETFGEIALKRSSQVSMNPTRFRLIFEDVTKSTERLSRGFVVQGDDIEPPRVTV
jgi:hypothetical protein